MQEITCDKNVFNQKIETTELGNSFKGKLRKNNLRTFGNY